MFDGGSWYDFTYLSQVSLVNILTTYSNPNFYYPFYRRSQYGNRD